MHTIDADFYAICKAYASIHFSLNCFQLNVPKESYVFVLQFKCKFHEQRFTINIRANHIHNVY